MELKHRISPTIPINLNISYPDGPNIGTIFYDILNFLEKCYFDLICCYYFLFIWYQIIPYHTGVNMQRVRVTVTAVSDVPVSWAGTIELIITVVKLII